MDVRHHETPLFRNVTLLSILLLVTWFIYLCPDSRAQRVASRNLFPVCAEGRVRGYIDKTGKIIIPPNFEAVSDFSGGLARVKIKGKLGFIDETGKIIVEPAFDFAEDFSEGLAAVAMRPRNNVYPAWGYIDRSGVFVVKPQYSFAGSFSFERAVIVALKANRWGVIDQTGQIIVKARYKFVSKYSEGLAAIRVGDKYGYINLAGQVVIKPTLRGYGNFSEGLALVGLGKIQDGYIDKTGQVILRVPERSEAGPFSEGLAPFKVRSGIAGCGYIDKTGQMALEPKFIDCGEFSEGLASVRFNESSDRVHYIDRTGRIIISTFFTLGFAFRGGMATVHAGTGGVPGYCRGGSLSLGLALTQTHAALVTLPGLSPNRWTSARLRAL